MIGLIKYNGCSFSEYQENCSFQKMQQNPRNPAFIKQFSETAIAARTRLSVDRAVDRPLPPVDRSVNRAPNRELGTFSRSTGRSTELHPCARRSTGPVDRAPATAGGRPGRSIELLLLLLLTCFVAAASFVFCRRLPRRSLDDPCRLPLQYSLFPTWLSSFLNYALF